MNSLFLSKDVNIPKQEKKSIVRPNHEIGVIVRFQASKADKLDLFLNLS
jgi:hypothetical protein